MAIATFKMKYFNNPVDLQVFVSTDTGVTTITAIVYDTQSNKYVLFYV